MAEPWIDSQKLLIALERRAAPEELASARLLRGRVRFVEDNTPDGELVVRGSVPDGGSAALDAVLTVRPSRVETSCGCGSKTWPCRHVVRLARAWAEERRTPRSRFSSRSGWRDVVGALVPRPGAAGTTVRRDTLIHWLDLQEGAGGVWNLLLSWRVHRVGARGIGKGRGVPPQAVCEGSEPWLTEPDRGAARILDALGALGKAGRTTDPVPVRGPQIDPVLRALARVPHAYWVGTRSAALWQERPISVRLAGVLRGDSLTVRAEWEPGSEGADPSTPFRVLGSSPPWVERGGVLAPVAGVEDGAALALLAHKGVDVPRADLPAFLGTAVPELESRGIAVALDGVDGTDFVIRKVPTPRLYLAEEGGLLVGTLRFAYGDYEISADRPEPVAPVGPANLQAFVRRDMEIEFQATRRLRGLGFRMVDSGRFEITGEEALDALREGLPALAGEWELYGQDDLRRYRVARSPVSMSVRLGAGIDWLSVDLEARVDGEAISGEELVWALRKGARYVRLGSGAHALLPSEWLDRVGPVLDEMGVDSSGARLPRYMAPLVEEMAERSPDVSWADRASWERLVSALHGGSPLPEPSVPEGFVGTLRPYQVDGFGWLRLMNELGFGCVLADDMGLGKTIQTLALLAAEIEEGRTGPSLVVAPTSVVPNWEGEARRFTPELRVLRYHGADRRDRVERFEGEHLVVTSYAVLRRDIRVLSAVAWNYAILDEAQAIKNSATQTARGVRRLRARRRLALTGTPLENHLGELWSQFQFLAPGLLGSERRFTQTFARPIAQGERATLDRLRRRIAPFVLRRLKNQVARDLPAKVESVLLCEMGPAQERLYRSLLLASRDAVFREVEQKGFTRARFSVLEALLRLRQACCHPEILPGGLGDGVPSAKFDLFRHFVSEVVDEGHRVLVFSQFVSVLRILRRWFEEAGIPHLYLDGRTRDRDDRVRQFQEDGSVAAFLVSLKAGGSGLNLTGADYVVLYDPWWNPAAETQAADRAHRIGQTRAVFSYKMITRGTVEERILALQERKRGLTEDLIRAGRAWGSAFTEEDLEELFRV